jgi:glycosyltransferase involved in cell wall biosynthesis
MATAILDVELDQLPSEITRLDKYNRALILVRLYGQPVGKTSLPVVDGRIGGTELHTALISAGGRFIWQRWLHRHLRWQQGGAAGSRPLKATIAICTRDRTEDLRRCIEALSRLPDDGQELLVVDNSPSTSATYELVAGYKHVRYVREDRAGLNIARNRALREARHPIVAFTDDDTAPDPGWLRALLANFDHPLTLCVTGLTMPLELETDAQEWFERHNPFGKGFERTIFRGTHWNPLRVGRVGAGANMALRATVPELVGFFDEALDAGTLTRSGGDHEMFSRILMAGYNITYDPAALSWHRHRRGREELRQTMYGYGVGAYAFMTRRLVVDREFGVVKLAWDWFRATQLPQLVRSFLRRPGSLPLDLLLAELRGCMYGPRAYFASRKRLRARELIT